MTPAGGGAVARLPRWGLRLLRRHRRLLAVLALAAAAGTATRAATAAPPAGVPVVVADADLAAGTALTDADLRVVDLPPAAVPDGVVDEPAGSTLAAPVRAGEPVTDVRVRGRGVLAGAPPGTVATTVLLPEPLTADLLEPGDAIDLLAPGPVELGGSEAARVVATGAVVLDVRLPEGDLLGTGDQAALALVAVRPEQARAVAGAQAAGPLSVVLLP